MMSLFPISNIRHYYYKIASEIDKLVIVYPF